MTAPSYRRIAVLDIGKTNAKVVVLDSGTGAEIAVLKRPNVTIKTGPYPHYDIEALWSFALDALKRLAREPGFDAISITTHGAAAALLDRHGQLAMPVIDYEHEYPEEIRDAYTALRPAFDETFSPRLTMGLNVGAQLHYQKSAFPEAFAKVATILTYAQYWTARLTGVAANELTSLGCHTDLWNPKTSDYSSLVDRLGIRALMAPIRSAFDALGPVLPGIAEELGLAAPVPVYCGIHDSNASLLPHLVHREAPFAVVSTGTWVINFCVGGDLDHLDAKRDALANVDAYGRAVPSSRFMGGREFEILSAEIGPVGEKAAQAAIGPAIEKGVMLLPNMAPGSGPFPGKASRWIGAEGASREERHAAACLYLALMTDACLGLIGAKGPVIVEGPFALNETYLKLLAALAGREVLALPGSTGTSQGAALLTGIRPVSGAETRVPPAEIAELAAYRDRWYAAME
ncbi:MULTISPECIES: FGGY-family carbohydrate kinase [Rhizobium]|uniref:FGGY-family carbohydrate kinase n=1 Tax=Rhizobium TaxID=379 RepID=UPI000BEA4578|nr:MULTISPECIES: FGGY-family carbohydrate kinase [Rhizobium]MBY4593348.1 FGGY-family carbohydrate kinase [Rhizobium redzepovicii]MDF0662823.1 FGGY-family carbohydrate kinase [Rhizobium sp. BC49]PDS82138.1 carbohydrate kinase [Rhizobium sp. L18]TBY50208.1 carbohydrate kinase [Rhizobium leguminosarum bv. viciae]